MYIVILLFGIISAILGIMLLFGYRYQSLCPQYEVIKIEHDSDLSVDKIDYKLEKKHIYYVSFDVDGDLCENMLVTSLRRINKNKQQYIFFDKYGNPQFAESYLFMTSFMFICSLLSILLCIYSIL